MIPIRVFKDQPVALFGLGRSGIAAGRALEAGGADVAAWDDGEPSRANAEEKGLTLVDLASADWGRFRALVLAPGVPLTHPEPHWVVNRARAAGVEIIGDTELFFRERAQSNSRSRVVAITGTNGKSTTSALIAHILRCADHDVALGGNIGTAILDLPELADNRIYVIEFSSFQIDLTPGLRPTAAALLNIAPDHLDRHGTIENYARVKSGIYSGLTSTDTAVIGVDDEHSRAIMAELEGRHETICISGEARLEDGVFAMDGQLSTATNGQVRAVADLRQARALRGVHNGQNAAAAFALARSLGLEAGAIEAGLKSFPGLAHRMEEVGRCGQAVFINDSKATNADAASRSLASFDDIYWIAGGRAKEGGIDALAPYFSKIVRAYLIGEASADFANALAGKVDHRALGTVEAAVAAAARDARESGSPEPTVLFAPACASFDQFPNFEVRGEAFRTAVASLEDVSMQESVKT